MTINIWTLSSFYAFGDSFSNAGLIYNVIATGSFTGTWASGVPTITSISGIVAPRGNSIAIGMGVSGTGIPAGSFITAFAGAATAPTSITLNQNTTAIGTAANVAISGYYSTTVFGTRDTNNATLKCIVQLKDTFDDWRIKTNQLGNGYLSNGVKTNNEDNTDPTFLDWYEEGSFTPALTFSTTNGTLAYGANGQVGRYQRIGNRVTFSCHIFLSVIGTAAGNATITGLPFTSANITNLNSSLSVFTSAMATTNNILAQVLFNTAAISLHNHAAGASAALTQANFTGASVLTIAGSYQV